MRFYVYTPGSPGYISAEVAVRELTDEHEARAWAEDAWPACFGGEDYRYISRAEALMVPLYREALERWDARDDAILQQTEVSKIRAEHRAEAEGRAAFGCMVAAKALVDGNQDAIREAISAHEHDQRCGGRDPELPGTRHLHPVN
jgi:hypothetical protein